jgi:hypothetical protein
MRSARIGLPEGGTAFPAPRGRGFQGWREALKELKGLGGRRYEKTSNPEPCPDRAGENSFPTPVLRFSIDKVSGSHLTGLSCSLPGTVFQFYRRRLPAPQKRRDQARVVKDTKDAILKTPENRRNFPFLRISLIMVQRRRRVSRVLCEKLPVPPPIASCVLHVPSLTRRTLPPPVREPRSEPGSGAGGGSK